MSQPRAGKKIFQRSVECIAAVGLVLLCYLGFTNMLNRMFPSSSLVSWNCSNDAIGTFGDLGLRKWLLFRSQGDTTEAAPNAARVGKIRNELKCKGSSEVAWRTAKEEMPLYSGDAVQTLDRSAATIQFNDQSHIELGERTLVVISKLEKDIVFGDPRSFILLMEGEFRGIIGGRQQGTSLLNVKIPAGTMVMHARRDPAEARVTTSKDNSSTVAVYKGSIEVSLGNEQVTIQANQGLRVFPGEAPRMVEALPAPARLAEPADEAQLTRRADTTLYRFSWEPNSGADSYRFVLARDPEFTEVMTEKIVRECSIEQRDLPVGSYYWRVSALHQNIEGVFSAPRRLAVSALTAPPRLDSANPAQRLFYREQPPQVTFLWQQLPGSRQYIWQLARDWQFNEVLAEKKTAAHRLTHTVPGAGLYFWRVGLQDAAGVRYGEPGRFAVVQDSVAPAFAIDFPAEAAVDREYVVSGRTEPGARVFIGGVPVDVSSEGAFRCVLRLDKGRNVIAAAAADPANNVASRSHIVICK